MFEGLGVSEGIAFGKVIIKRPYVAQENKGNNIKVEDVEKEILKFQKALEKTRLKTRKLYEKTLKTLGKKEAEIFKAHEMMLEDPEIIQGIEDNIREDLKDVQASILKITNIYIKRFKNMTNPYFQERAIDLKDIQERLLKNIILREEDMNLDVENQIIIAEELTPSDTVQLDLKKVKGFVTAVGGETSHTAIMAKSLGIPAVIGIKDILDCVEGEEDIVIDGEKGLVILSPSKEVINEYKEKQLDFFKKQNQLRAYINKETITKDGHRIEIAGNIGGLSDVKGILEQGAEGIGLFRTEFIYMNSSDFPTENEQFNIYKQVVEKMKNKPVIIRTLDIGGDKNLDYFDFPNEMNPFLGYRAIRFCLDRPALFKIQLRSILRASVYGKIRLMFPMISSLEELELAKDILEEAKESLRKEDIAFDDMMPVGMMIEVPSAAMISDILAKHVDFFSIGTNDLIQYTVAVDRMNDKIKKLYSPLNIGVLRLINQVIQNAHKEGIWVGMCGEVAGNEKLIPILLGMGLDEFSMSKGSILRAKELINGLSREALKPYVNEVLNCEKLSTVNEIIYNIRRDFQL